MGARTDEERANARVGSSPPFAMPPAAASEDGQKLDLYPLWSFRELVVQFVHRALVGLPRRRLGGGQLQDANESSPEERRPQAGRKPRSVTGWGRGQEGYSGVPVSSAVGWTTSMRTTSSAAAACSWGLPAFCRWRWPRALRYWPSSSPEAGGRAGRHRDHPRPVDRDRR
jgi:hypothetical protein